MSISTCNPSSSSAGRRSTKLQKSVAHSSAAAAVAILDGGLPYPYPSSLPSLLTTTTPKPVHRKEAQLFIKRLPSVYQVALCALSASGPVNGSLYQRNVPSFRGFGAGIFKTATPRNFSSVSLSSPILCSASLQIFGVGVLLLMLSVALQTNWWAIVPGSAWQSWQDESVIFQLATLHLRVWVHWPPLIAETNAGAHAFDHVVVSFFKEAFPFASGAIAPKRSWKIVCWSAAVLVSENVGAACGNNLSILFNLHLLTDALVAVTKEYEGPARKPVHCQDRRLWNEGSSTSIRADPWWRRAPWQGP